jgi:hypothetical protein
MKMKKEFLLVLICLCMAGMLIAGCTTPTTTPPATTVATPVPTTAAPVKTPVVTATQLVEYKGCPVVTNDLYNTRSNMTFTGLRGYRFAEIFLTCDKTSPCYNTAGLNIGADPKDSVPDSLLANYSNEVVAAQYQVPSVYFNGPKIWMFDEMVIPTGDQIRDFDGIKARWMAYSDEAGQTKPYEAFTIGRASTFNWNKGKLAYILDDPNGTPWIMKSYNPKYVNASDLSTLDKKLKLPAGWKFRVVTLPADLIEVPVNGTAWLVQDEFQGVYDKALAGTGMNYTP